jgi:hypothetical protein
MRIPEIRERLNELAATLACPELATLADELKRRPVRRRAERVSTPVTPELRTAIRAYHTAHPAMTQAEIGRVFNVNPGRVSEALRGWRH